MLIGASMGAEDVDVYGPKLSGNDIMRIFPQKLTIAGKENVGVLQPWTDPRLEYCRKNNVIPFLSTKLDGYAAGLAYVKQQLINMPSWLRSRPGVVLWITERHEPEGDYGSKEPEGANAYKAAFKAFVDMLDTLEPALRAKIWVGPILTRTWTEKAGTNRNYDAYDPMSLGAKYGGNFFGVDMYHETGTASAVVKPSTIMAPASFVAKFKAYKFSSADSRPRIWPELGLIGMPEDTTGSARTAWIQGVHDEARKMRAGQPGWNQPWDMLGWIWWHQIGKATGQVRDVGEQRAFPLHVRSQPEPEKTYSVTDPASGETKTYWFAKIVELPGTPPLPLAKFNQIYAAEHSGVVAPDPIEPEPEPEPEPPAATPTWSYWVGATMKKADIAAYEARIPLNGMFRIFPNGSTDLPPDWDDARFAYARRSGAVPFCSSNIDGDASKFAAMRQWILNMPQWLRDRPGVVLYLTDRHEPENNFKQNAAAYLTNYRNWYNAVIRTLPADLRAKVAAGPVVTLQWIVNPNNGNGNYQQYDPGPADSDFYAIDMYMGSWKPGSSANATKVAEQYVDPVAFLAGVKGYRYNNSANDTRPRIFAELGSIGIPSDPTGAQRAAWINGVCAELDTWTPAEQGWKFLGFAWWNNQGTTSTTALSVIGTLRYFYLDSYQKNTGAPVAYADPLPLKAFNARAKAHYVPAPVPGDPGTPNQGAAALSAASNLVPALPGTPGPVIPPPVIVPPQRPLPDSAADPRLQAIYTVLVTDPYLRVLGSPLSGWTSMDITLRWKEPGSGQIVMPADPSLSARLPDGCRIVVLRRALGTQHTLLAGPMEKLLFEKSNGTDDNGGAGQYTINFVEDLAWLGARVTYPNPDRVPDAQLDDYWTYAGNPEQAMLKLVSEQAGRQALSARQVPALTVAPYSGLSDASVQIVGTTDVQPRSKFEKVTDVLRRICTQGANSLIPDAPVYHPDSLGFRTRQTTLDGAAVILFEPVRSRDLSRKVFFSFEKGNLQFLSHERSAASFNALVVGGGGDGSDAYVREALAQEPDAFSWGRFESFQSELGSEIQSNVRLQEVIDTAFAESLPSARLTINATDTPDQRFGIHYTTGDIVGYSPGPGLFESAPVQTVLIQVYASSGEVVSVTVGDQSARYDSPFIRRLRDLDRRLGHMERRGNRG